MPKSKTAKAAKPSVPSWMDNVLKVKPKNSRRKSALQKKVAKVYKDTILPGHDEREGPSEVNVDDILIDTSDEPAIVPEPSEPIVKKPIATNTQAISELMNSISTLHKRVELADNSDPIGRRPLKRPPVDSTPGCIFSSVRDALHKVVQMYLNEADYENVAKYSAMMLEFDQQAKKMSPVVREGAIFKQAVLKGKRVKATMYDPNVSKYSDRSIERKIARDKALDDILVPSGLSPSDIDSFDDTFQEVTNNSEPLIAPTLVDGLQPGGTKQIDQFLDRLKPVVGANLSRRPNTQNVSG